MAKSKLDRLGLTENEIVTAVRSLRRGVKPQKTKRIHISRKSFSFGYISDTHIGHKMFDDELFAYAVKYFHREKPDFILHPGD